MSRPLSSHKISTKFLFIAFSLCLGYVVFELFFNAYAMITVDEFWFAHRIYQYQGGLPYRDFSPYKTVLGYYFLLLPMMISAGKLPAILATLITMKNALALLNACIFFVSSCWLSRFFSRNGVLTALALVIFSEIVLSYSTQIRVDLLAYWFGLFAILCLLEKRFIIAGLLFGLGFATSQKMIWYIVAANCALLSLWLINTLLTTKEENHYFRKIVSLNMMIALTIFLYLLCWSYISHFDLVANNMFHEALVMYQLDWYDHTRFYFWFITLLFNPLMFLLAPLTIISLFITFADDWQYQHRMFISIFSWVILICLVFYKQVFPYYMQVTIPVFFLLFSAFFSWISGLIHAYPKLHFTLSKTTIGIIITLYLLTLSFALSAFHLPYIYFMIILMVIFFYLALIHISFHRLYFNLMMISFIFMGFLYPLALFTNKLPAMNGDYQKAHLHVLNNLLKDHSDYVAGIELIYNKTQPIAGLRHLMGPAVQYLSSPSKKLAAVMLDSLYEDPSATIDTVIQSLDHSSVKFYVNNYRMMALPNRLKHYLADHYQHLWGSIYFYSLKVEAGKNHIQLNFSGYYRIDANSFKPIKINHALYQTNSLIYLTKGVYLTDSDHLFRLSLLPDHSIDFNQKWQKDEFSKIIF